MYRTFTAAAALLAATAAVAAGSGFDASNLDRSVPPTQNFFKFANGGWQKANPIPPDYSRWGTFTQLYLKNQKRLKKLVEEAAGKAAPKPGSERAMVGDFFASGMDTDAIDKAGVAPLKPQLDAIAAITKRSEIGPELARLQAEGVNAFFGFGSEVSRDNSARTIAAVDQGGLGLPDRSYYLKDNDRNKKVRAAYRAYVAKAFELAGRSEADAKTAADTVMQIETALAKASMSKADRRDPYATWHMTKVAKLEKLAPAIDWSGYFKASGAPAFDRLNVAEPKFFTEVSRLVAETPLDQVRTYLTWQLLMAASPYLSGDFQKANFAYESALSGQQQQRPRWIRVLGAENQAIGFALGKLYVAEYFPPQDKKSVEAILRNIRAALAADIKTLPWMSPKTRAAAIKKLDMIKPKIGYPDHWRSYDGLKIDRGPYVLNVLRAARYNNAWDLSHIGKATDRSIWYMTPQTVNAYYDPSTNQIVFPAAILQPPFYTAGAPLALNYGAVGAVMGHEISHGFDDEGRHYDGRGNLHDWWTKADSKRFDKRAQCIIKQFDGYTVPGGDHVNGKLVTGEAIADLGGVTIAHKAFESLPQAEKKGEDGFTASQLFFLGFAHVWASNIRPDAERLQVSRDPHPPAVYRVNGTLANVPAFWKAFDVPKGSPMRHQPPCEIW